MRREVLVQIFIVGSFHVHVLLKTYFSHERTNFLKECSLHKTAIRNDKLQKINKKKAQRRTRFQLKVTEPNMVKLISQPSMKTE